MGRRTGSYLGAGFVPLIPGQQLFCAVTCSLPKVRQSDYTKLRWASRTNAADVLIRYPAAATLIPACCPVLVFKPSWLSVALQDWVRAARVFPVQLIGQPHLLTHSTKAVCCGSIAALIETLIIKGGLKKEVTGCCPGCRHRPLHISKQHLRTLRVHLRVGLT